LGFEQKFETFLEIGFDRCTDQLLFWLRPLTSALFNNAQYLSYMSQILIRKLPRNNKDILYVWRRVQDGSSIASQIPSFPNLEFPSSHESQNLHVVRYVLVLIQLYYVSEHISSYVLYIFRVYASSLHVRLLGSNQL
jgi:hypothetical protein